MVLSFLIAAGLEIVDRADDTIDSYCFSNYISDILQASISKWCLVQSVLTYAAGIDSLHF